MARAISTTPQREPPAAPVRPSPVRILVSDDDTSLLLLYQAILHSANHDVVFASDGVEALQHIETDDPDLVLLDLNMPNLDGIGVLRELAATGKYLPIVLVSSTADLSQRLEGLEAGAVDYVTKPFDTEALLQLINNIHRLPIETVQRYRNSSIEHMRTHATKGTHGHYPGLRLQDLDLDATVKIDKDRNIVYFNRGAETIFGYDAADVTGKPIDCLFPERMQGIQRQYLNGLIEAPDDGGDLGYRSDIFAKRSDGTIFPAEESLLKVSGTSHTLVTIIIRDVTKQRETEVQLRRASEQRQAIVDLTRSAAKSNSWNDLETMAIDIVTKQTSAKDVAVLDLSALDEKSVRTALESAAQPSELRIEIPRGNSTWGILTASFRDNKTPSYEDRQLLEITAAILGTAVNRSLGQNND